MLRNNINYVLLLLTFVLALLSFIKEWEAHKTWTRRGLFLIVTIAVTIGTGVNIYWTAQQEQTDRSNAKAAQTRLEGIIEGGQDTSVKAIGALSDKVGDLQTQIKTADLRDQAIKLQAELKATQAALAPGPKAELSFTFFPFPNVLNEGPTTPVKDVTLPRNLDGSVHVEFTILNLTEVDAETVEINFEICDLCKFAKEPEGLRRLAGLVETQRYLAIPNLQAKEAFKILSVDISPPPTGQDFPIGIEYRCHTCVLPKSPSSGVVHISR